MACEPSRVDVVLERISGLEETRTKEFGII
jgi:hypothetical protein